MRILQRGHNSVLMIKSIVLCTLLIQILKQFIGYALVGIIGEVIVTMLMDSLASATLVGVTISIILRN